MKKLLLVLLCFGFIVLGCKSISNSSQVSDYNTVALLVPICKKAGTTPGTYVFVYEALNTPSVKDAKIDSYKGCLATEQICSNKENYNKKSSHYNRFFNFTVSKQSDVLYVGSIIPENIFDSVYVLGISSNNTKEPIQALKGYNLEDIKTCTGVYAEAESSKTNAPK